MGDWSASFCGCCDDCGSCCCSMFVPCYQYGDNVAHSGVGLMADAGSCSHLLVYLLVEVFLPGCGCVLVGMHRGQIRQKYGINGSAFDDFLLSCCCQCCTLAQIAREVKNRPSSGAPGATVPVGAYVSPVVQPK